MKKVLAVFLLLVSASAMAQHHGHHGHNVQRGGWHGNHWVGPALIGGIIGYEIFRNQPPVYVQPPVYMQQQNCSLWTETENLDGTITRTRTCSR